MDIFRLTLIDVIKWGAVVVLAFIVILGTRVRFIQPESRAKVSRAKSELRRLAVGIESYYIDSNEYPAMTMDPNRVMDRQYYKNRPTVVGRTFMARHDSPLISLTTPVAYLTDLYADPFADHLGTGFRYFQAGSGWIVGSWGPDRDQATGGQLMWNAGDIGIPGRLGESEEDNSILDVIERVYNPDHEQPSPLLIGGGRLNGAYTYNPTNGTISAGDVWRVKQ